MVVYPKEAYAPAMEVYKHIPDELKEEANEILGQYSGDNYAEGEAPPYEMTSKLLSLVPKERQRGLEAIVESAREYEEKIKQKQVAGAASTSESVLFRTLSTKPVQYATAGALVGILISML